MSDPMAAARRIGILADLLGIALPGGLTVTERSRRWRRQPGPGPVIMLACAHAGAGDLMALPVSQSLACTLGSGLLPLCDSAAAIWQKVENRGRRAANVSPEVDPRAGDHNAGRRPSPGPALRDGGRQLFAAPENRPDVPVELSKRHIRVPAPQAAGRAGRGDCRRSAGPGGGRFWLSSGGHRGSRAATIAGDWAACARSLLEFQAARQDAWLRVRCGDLAAELAEVRDMHAMLDCVP